MYYLVFNFFALTYCLFLDKFRFRLAGKVFIAFLFIVSITLVPGFQYGVGTDYFSYENIYNNQSELNKILLKREFLFYYLVLFCKFIQLDFKGFVLFITLIYSILIYFAISIFSKRNLINISFVFFVFFTVTNLMHTQMNLFRASFAMYLFVISFLFYANNNKFIAIFLSAFSVFFHMSAALLVPLFFIPLTFWRFTYKHCFSFYVLTFVIILSFPLENFLFFLVNFFAPQYSFYLNDLAPEVSILNIVSKLYYIPLHFLFFYFFYKKRFIPNDFGVVLIGFWCLTANFYLLMINFDFFSRVNYFFVFFYIVPIVYLLDFLFLNRRWLILFGVILYILIPYSAKVVYFSIAEFSYETFLF